MDERIIKYLDKALDLEEMGCIDEAVALYEKMTEAFPEYREEVYTEKAKLEFRNMREKEALLDFLRAYAVHQNAELYELVLEAFLKPNLEELQERYQKNGKLLRDYPFYKNDFETDELDVYVLWMDAQLVVMVNVTEKSFGVIPYKKHGELEQQERSLMLISHLWLEDLFYYKDKTKKAEPFMDQEIPFYLVYNRNDWMLFAQITDIEKVIGDAIKRVVILAGEKSFRDYFADTMAVHPDNIIRREIKDWYIDLLDEIARCKSRDLEEYTKKNAIYYQTNSDEIVQNVQSQRPRILFWTSRYTTALQYHVRDCMHAAQRMGCETKLLIEPDGVHGIYPLTYQKYISDFKPDMIFSIDHFRFEHSHIPENLPWMMWVQDPLNLIMDPKTPAKLLDRDLVMIHCISWKEFDAVGYPKKYLIDAAIPADANIYRPYALSAKEREAYACDICLVCHASDIQSHIEGMVKKFPESRREMIYAIYAGYQSYVYETGNLFYKKEDFLLYIRGAMSQRFGVVTTEEILHALAEDMWMSFNQRVYRQALADWLIDAGYTNIKLWGDGWQENEKYRAYAMGPAQNGETLSKIYQASKIVLGNNVMTTAAARAWETMLSGGFYLSNYIPPEHDAVDIRKIMELETEVAVFYDREDLLRKVSYYLCHEQERQRMIEIGRKAALERMTYDVLMKRVIAETGKRLAAVSEAGEKEYE